MGSPCSSTRAVEGKGECEQAIESAREGGLLMAMPIPTEEDVLGWMTTLSNWGRWGPEDELGTLNLITPEKRV